MPSSCVCSEIAGRAPHHGAVFYSLRSDVACLWAAPTTPVVHQCILLSRSIFFVSLCMPAFGWQEATGSRQSTGGARAEALSQGGSGQSGDADNRKNAAIGCQSTRLHQCSFCISLLHAPCTGREHRPKPSVSRQQALSRVSLSQQPRNALSQLLRVAAVSSATHQSRFRPAAGCPPPRHRPSAGSVVRFAVDRS